MKSLLLSFTLFSVLVLNACGGGGGTGGTGSNQNPGTNTNSGTSSSPVVKITGQLSVSAPAKPSDKMAAQRAVSSWTGTTLGVVDASGSIVGTGTVQSAGTYLVLVPTGTDYFVRAQVANLVLKAFVPTVSADMIVNLTRPARPRCWFWPASSRFRISAIPW